MTLEAIFNHPVFIAGASVAVVAIVNALVRQIGKGAKTPARIASLEKGQEDIRKSVAPLVVLPEQAVHADRHRLAGHRVRAKVILRGGGIGTHR